MIDVRKVAESTYRGVKERLVTCRQSHDSHLTMIRSRRNQPSPAHGVEARGDVRARGERDLDKLLRAQSRRYTTEHVTDRLQGLNVASKIHKP
jgi:hypothetical protein